MRFMPFALCIILLAGMPSPSLAWSKFAHELICEMAFQQLTDEARQTVIWLSIGENAVGGNRTFAESCKWADDARHENHRETYEYHFINVPRYSDKVDFSRDCVAYDCVSQAVVRYAAYFSDDSLNESSRAEALRFLGHFVGDLHQPLHVGFKEDFGGNILYVAPGPGRKPKKLDAIWDGDIPFRIGFRASGDNDRERQEELSRIARNEVRDISDAQRTAWNSTGVMTWAEQSYSLAVTCAYRVDCDENADYLENGDILSANYWANSEPIVRERIRKAATRLAWIINQSVSGDLDLQHLSN